MQRIITVILLLSLAATAAAQEDSPRDPLRPSGTRWLVRFERAVPVAAQKELAVELGAELVRLGPYADFVLLRFDSPPKPMAAERLARTPGVVYAEREARYRTAMHLAPVDPDDPLEPLQWSHRMINLPAALDINFGSDPSVAVAILDTGVAYADFGAHSAAPDLAGTVVLDGYDFVGGDVLALDEGDGSVGHGTFVAGVVAQTTHNARGTAGIAFNASLLPVRVAGRRGIARAAELARGIRYAVASGASIIVVGVAGPADSRAVREAVRFAYRCGVAVFAPAGNRPEVQFPARYREVLSVGAVDAAGRRAHYSPASGPVDIYAPGGDLRPGVDADSDGRPDGVIAETFRARRFGSFGPVMLEGTSAAAAHAAGAAALLLSQVGPLPPERLYSALRSSARLEGGLPLLDAARLLFRASAIAY